MGNQKFTKRISNSTKIRLIYMNHLLLSTNFQISLYYIQINLINITVNCAYIWID